MSVLAESSFPRCTARLAQSVEHETLNLRVVGSSPTLGAHLLPLSMGETEKRDGGDERQRRSDGASRFEGKTFHALKLASSGKPFDLLRLENWRKIGTIQRRSDGALGGKLERYREDRTGPLADWIC